MKERLINSVLHSMQDILTSEQISVLKGTLENVLQLYDVVPEKQELRVMDDSWRDDMEDYLMAKSLEGLSKDTITQYRYEITRVLSYINKAVARVKPSDVSGYLRAYKKMRGVGNQTLCNVRSYLSGFFGWLHARARVPRNIMVMVEKIKVEKKIKKPFSEEQREKIARSCLTLRDMAMIEFFYSTAVRVSEFESINIADIRWSDKNLTVVGKGSKERYVYLNEKSHMYLKEYLESRTDDNPALFVWEKKPFNRLKKGGIEAAVARIGKRADVEKTHPHRLRRTAATNASNRGMPLQEVSVMLGHAKLETTMIYCTVEQEAVQYGHKKYLSA